MGDLGMKESLAAKANQLQQTAIINKSIGWAY